MEDHGEKTVVTPLSSDNPYNFGPASIQRNNTIVHTCERPGGDVKGANKIPTKAKVQAWKEFMTTPERNIRHVFILLGDSELEAYDPPGLIQAYQDAGIIVHHIPYSSPKSFSKIMAELDECDQKGENAVVHCTHGMGRSGRVAAGWLVHKYGLSVEQAVEEALEAARKFGVERMGSPRQLEAWMVE